MKSFTGKIQNRAKTATRNSFSWKSLGVFMALLCCLAAGFFIIKAGSSNESRQSQNVEPIFDPQLHQTQSARVLILPAPEITESAKPENTGQTTVEPIKAQKIVEKREIADNPMPKTEVTKETVSVPVEIVLPRTETRNAPPKKREKRDRREVREVSNEPIPDIESIFTGRNYNSGKVKIRYEREQKNGRDEKRDKKQKKHRP